MKDLRFYTDEKISLWKCFKYFWTPKNWFNYRDNINIEVFWFTFLANLIFSTALAALFLPCLFLLLILFNTGAKFLLFYTLGAIVFSSIFLFIGMSLGGFAMTFNRANNAGIPRSRVWGFFFSTSLLSTLLGVLTLSGFSLLGLFLFTKVQDPLPLALLELFPWPYLEMSNILGNFFGFVSFCAWLWIGIKSEKIGGARSDDVLPEQTTLKS